MTSLDAQVYLEWKRNPQLFITAMWGLVPQKVLPEHREKLLRCRETGEYDDMERDDFEPFVKGKHITRQQAEFVEAVRRGVTGEGQYRISIRSGHGVGKSSSSSRIIIWALFCYYKAQVACTAPSAPQLKGALWKELYSWIKKMPEEVQAMYEWQSDHVRMVQSPGDWFARAKTGKKETPEALAGVHSEEGIVVQLADEASGVDDIIYTKMEGSQTGSNNLTILISNPTRNHGYFYDTFHKSKKFRQNLHFNCNNSPLNTTDYVNYIIERYGLDSPEYRYMVEGNFPEADGVDNKGFVPLLDPNKIVWSYDSTMKGRMFLGVDPSGDGSDKTKRVIRNNSKAYTVLSESVSNEKSIADKTYTLMTEYNIKPSDVYIDNFGVGANVGQELGLMGVRVNAVNVGNRDGVDETFMNRRAQAYWRMREWINRGGELVNKSMREDEVPALRYQRNISGKIQMMGKKDIKKNFGFSPDNFDALMLTFYDQEKKFNRDKGSTSFSLDYSRYL